MAFLDEQLDRIYLTENVEKGLSQLRFKREPITQAMKTGNLFKARTLLNTLPDASLDEVMQVAHKGKDFHRFHLEAKRMVKGDTTEMQKVFVLCYASLKAIQAQVRNEGTVKEIDDLLLKLRDFAKKYGPRFTSEGFTLSLIMVLLSFFFQSVPILGTAISIAGGAGIIVFFLNVIASRQ